MHAGFRWENLKQGNNLEDPGVDSKIILKLIFENWDGGMDWIDLAWDKNRLQALVNAIMKRIESWLRCYVTGLFGGMSVFAPRIKEMLQLWPEQVWMVHRAETRNT